MKLLKKLGVMLLTTALAIGSIFVSNTKNSYAETSYKKQIYLNTVYRYDIDGDGDKDRIEVYASGEKLLLQVNSCVKILDSEYFPEEFDYDVKIYDFNKNDKSSEIVLTSCGYGSWNTRILKFKNSTCKLNKCYYDAQISSYTSSNGMITLEECDWGRYNKFANAIGCFSCYDKVRINGYNAYNQYTANTTSYIRKNKYIASKDLTAYTSTSGTKKAFTIKKGSSAYIYALYQNGSKRYIKVKNKYGKYGYVKVGTSLLFKKSSCIWWR